MTASSLLQQVKKMTPLDPEAVTPFVGEALRRLRAEVRLVCSNFASRALEFAPSFTALYVLSHGGCWRNRRYFPVH